MVEVIFTDDFKKVFSKIKDNLTKKKIIKQIQKLKENPFVGKSLKYKKFERSLYVKPFRLVYSFRKDEIILLKFEHIKSVYKK